VDVIDPEFIPSVSHPTPGGLTLEETSLIIRKLRETQKLKVFELAAYDASRDRSRSSARTIIELLKPLVK
jgi:arginase family enzyme